ncbi:NYN domain-containing protein [Streptomyces sp. NPDC006349]|uniref:NYN domain-containing protein n=1 Tax=Streptomyces sp. NPDC006349 TaxID=3156757 RepID=UPI0033A69F8B
MVAPVSSALLGQSERCTLEPLLPALLRDWRGFFISGEVAVEESPTPAPRGPLPAPPLERVAVFIDYQNVHLSAREAFLPWGSPTKEGHIDPCAFARALVAMRKRPSRLLSVRVYRGRPDPRNEPDAAAANDRQAAVWQRGGAIVCRRPLRYPHDWPDLPAREKGIDVQLACDVITEAMTHQVDAVIIASRDTDLTPALEIVRSRRLAHVETASWEGASRIRFPGEHAPWCHRMDEAAYESVRDHRDYSKS